MKQMSFALNSIRADLVRTVRTLEGSALPNWVAKLTVHWSARTLLPIKLSPRLLTADSY